MLEVLVKTFSRCHLFDSCWVQGESSSCSMQQMLRFGKSMGEHTTEPDPGASMPSCQKVPGLFWQQRLQLLQSFRWAETQYGKASKENGQLTWFWHDPHRLIGCMEGLNKTSIHLHLLLVCPCPGDTHDLKLDAPLCSWKAASCISATPLRSHFAVCLAVHLCQNNGVWEKSARNKKKKKESYYFQIRAWPPTKCPKLPWQLTHNVLFLCVSRQHNGLPPWCCLSWHFRLPEDLESHSLL